VTQVGSYACKSGSSMMDLRQMASGLSGAGPQGRAKRLAPETGAVLAAAIGPHIAAMCRRRPLAWRLAGASDS
jgi:hypothetical protein